MVAGSILPATIHEGEIYFLFGKENPMEDSAKGWSDFGGRVDEGETIFEAALREGSEELTGFLGDSATLKKTIKNAGGTYKIQHNNYHVHLFFMEYDENLPKYYNKNHYFLWKKMDKNLLNESKLFEKIEIGWFSMKDMEKNKKIFREFYREIVDRLLGDRENIERFLSRNKRKLPPTRGKTQKMRF
jgi:8-oxo-dGTP pyrophosphatase MutT (NUDIX family)